MHDKFSGSALFAAVVALAIAAAATLVSAEIDSERANARAEPASAPVAVELPSVAIVDRRPPQEASAPFAQAFTRSRPRT